MAEYIEREAFRKNLDVDKYGYTDIVKVNIALQKAKADVVEVVRCKDCKHYDIRNARCLLHSELADQYSSGFNFEMYSKDYCSYGEKMDGKGEDNA